MEAVHILSTTDLDLLRREQREEIKAGFIELRKSIVEQPMRTKDAAAFLSITPAALLKLVARDKHFPHWRLGSTHYFYPSKMNEYIQKKR